MVSVGVLASVPTVTDSLSQVNVFCEVVVSDSDCDCSPADILFLQTAQRECGVGV